MNRPVELNRRALWRVLLPVGLGTALSLMGDATLYAVLPTHTEAAGVTLASVGLLLSANRWIRLALNGPAGWLYDRWPRRGFFTAALGLGVLATALCAFTQGFWPLLAARLLWGLAWSGIWVGGTTIILDVAAPRDRGRWIGLYQFAFYFGSSLGFLSGGLMTDSLGYHDALKVAAGVMLVGALVTLLILPETRGWRAALAADEVRVTTAETHAASPVPRASLISATALYTVNRFVSAGILSTTLGLLIQQRWGEARFPGGGLIGIATLTGGLLSLSTLMAMLAAPVAGHWSDRLGNRWRVAARGLVVGGLGLGVLLLVSASADGASAPVLILLGVVLTALSGGSNQSIATTVLGDLTSTQQRGRAIGGMHTFGDLGSALAPMLAYALLPFVGLPGLYALCVLIVLTMTVDAAHLARRHALAPEVVHEAR
jgi:MFS family permease